MSLFRILLAQLWWLLRAAFGRPMELAINSAQIGNHWRNRTNLHREYASEA